MYLLAAPELAALEIGDGLRRVDAERAGDVEELRDIESSLATLELGHKGLGPAELLCQGHLRQARVPTSLNERLAHLHMFSTKGRLRHWGSVLSQDGISQNRL
jgi:hypothetical protein